MNIIFGGLAMKFRYQKLCSLLMAGAMILSCTPCAVMAEEVPEEIVIEEEQANIQIDEDVLDESVLVEEVSLEDIVQLEEIAVTDDVEESTDEYVQNGSEVVAEDGATELGLSLDNPIDISIGQVVSRTTTEAHERAYYRFVTSAELSSYTVSVSGTNGWVYVGKRSGDRVNAIATENNGFVYETGSYIYKLEPNQTYYVKFECAMAPIVTYNIQVSATPDEPDTAVAAKATNVGESITGNICIKADTDWFKFNTGSTLSSYTISATGTSGIVNVNVYDSSMKLKGAINEADISAKSVVAKLPVNSTGYIEVSYGDKSGDYTIGISSSPDEPDTQATAKNVNITTGVSGNICSSDDIDYYVFKATKNGRYTLTFSSDAGGLNVAVLNKGGVNKGSASVSAFENSSITFEGRAGQNYYICLNGSAGGYRFWGKVKAFALSTSVKKLVNGKRSFIVTVKGAKDGEGYQVQYSIKSNMKNAKKKTFGYGSKKCTASGLKSGKTYYVQVRSYRTVDGKKIYSSWSKAKKIKVK